nr:hypothetical protein BgiMline_019720 [Biomphalaria glabrata]
MDVPKKGEKNSYENVEGQEKAAGIVCNINEMTPEERRQLAYKLMEKQGDKEFLISFCESDLHNFYEDCEKNPRHEKFYPIDQFSITLLPRKYQTMELYHVIKSLGFLTVRVEVRSATPKDCESSLNKSITYGTGRIYDVKKYVGDDKVCPCADCKAGTPVSEWLSIKAMTAKHIVPDNIDASHTFLKLVNGSHKSENYILDGISAQVSSCHDWCRLTCITHDTSLFNKVDEELKAYNMYARRLYEFYRHSRGKEKFVVIISCPHGCSKQISFGYWCQREQTGGIDTAYTYTAPTCVGSSGASVFILGRDGRQGLFNQIHSGCRSRKDKKNNFIDGEKVNFSTCVPE